MHPQQTSGIDVLCSACAQRRLLRKKTSIEKAFEVLQEDGPNGGIITVDRPGS